MASLPSRERGLKSYENIFTRQQIMSLPSRERGLKFIINFGVIINIKSLPSRERGLKCKGLRRNWKSF